MSSETPNSTTSSSASLGDTTASTPRSSVPESEELKKYRQLWWKTGNLHPKANWNKVILPYELMKDVTLDDYIIQTDKHNVKGYWEWENRTVRVIEVPSPYHEEAISTIEKRIGALIASLDLTPAEIRSCGSTTTKTRGASKEPDASYRPHNKLQASGNGYDGKFKPWPNLVIEVAYSQDEWRLKDTVENYWLLPGRVHDAIAIKLNYTTDGAVPTEMTAWHYCVNNRTDSGAFAPVMYEFGTIDRQGNPINIQLGQRVINIPLECIYHGMPNDFVFPSPPFPNPIPIDLFYVRHSVLIAQT